MWVGCRAPPPSAPKVPLLPGEPGTGGTWTGCGSWLWRLGGKSILFCNPARGGCGYMPLRDASGEFSNGVACYKAYAPAEVYGYASLSAACIGHSSHRITPASSPPEEPDRLVGGKRGG